MPWRGRRKEKCLNIFHRKLKSSPRLLIMKVNAQIWWLGVQKRVVGRNMENLGSQAQGLSGALGSGGYFML